MIPLERMSDQEIRERLARPVGLDLRRVFEIELAYREHTGRHIEDPPPALPAFITSSPRRISP